MNYIQIDMANPPQVIHLGRRGENLAAEIIFDCSELVQQYGMGTVQLLHLSSHGVVYPIAAVQDGVLVHWTVTSCDTACEGIGKCELHWLVNDVTVISAEINTLVYHSLSGCAAKEPPESSASWVETVLQASESAKASAQAAKTAPYINESGTWSLYDVNSGTYIDSGLPSRGERGLQGEKGAQGIQGLPGEPAQVTSKSVISALGYAPASANDIQQACSAMTQIKSTTFSLQNVSLPAILYKVGKVVWFISQGDMQSLASGNSTLGTIPSGYRPMHDTRFEVGTYSPNYITQMFITVSGIIHCYNYGQAAASPINFHISSCWLTEE